MEFPVVDLEFLDIVAKIWQMFASKSFIYDEDVIIECWTGCDRVVTHDPGLKLGRLSPWAVHRSVSHRERPFRLSGRARSKDGRRRGYER